jgi:hypothetical protein
LSFIQTGDLPLESHSLSFYTHPRAFFFPILIKSPLFLEQQFSIDLILKGIAQQKSHFHHARTKYTPPCRPAGVSIAVLHLSNPGAGVPVDEEQVPGQEMAEHCCAGRGPELGEAVVG